MESDQTENMEVDSTQESNSKPEENRIENMEEGESEGDAPATDSQCNDREKNDSGENGTSNILSEAGDKTGCSSASDTSKENASSPSSSTAMPVVTLVDDTCVISETSYRGQNVSNEVTGDSVDSLSQDAEKETPSGSANVTSAEHAANEDKAESETDVLEVITVETTNTSHTENADSSTTSQDKDDSNSEASSKNPIDLTEEQTPEEEHGGTEPPEVQLVGDAGEDGTIKEGDGNDSGSKMDDSEDIIELPVHKEPAVLVDLVNEDETEDKNKNKSVDKSGDEAANSEGNRRIKLRSLASLVDGGNKEPQVNSVMSTSRPDIPGIGEIVEHGVIIGSDEMDGLHLRISNVVGGEDCITGLTVDEDRDTFSSIQISSVTTLIDPMSPEDPNQANDSEKVKDNKAGEKEASEADKVTGSEGSAQESAKPQGSGPEELASSSADAVTSKDPVPSEPEGEGVKSSEENQVTEKPSKEKETEKPSEDKVTEKPSDEKEVVDSSESASPKIRLSSAVSEVAKDTGMTEKTDAPRQVYHILRSILTVKRECVMCVKNGQCEFRIVKKDENGTWAYLCSSSCRTKWSSTLPPNHVLEKPRLIFEKLCGMCGKDLTNVSRNGQYSWETRDFCSKTCLTQHLNEVAGKCHMCYEKVRTFFIGKYCVRFGSDIHQFCSNTCLERYKTKIKVCCYCQKNLDKVVKVTSVANKEYCSVKCLKRAQRRDIGQQNYNEQFSCTVCQVVGLNRYEFVSNQESYQLCSDPCLNVYKYANKVKAVPCCLCFRVMNAEDVAHYHYHGGHQLRVFCSDSCVNVFILSARKIVVCDSCKVKKYNFDMIHRQIDEDFRDYFYCSLNCLSSKEPSSAGKKSKNGVTSTSTAKNGSVTSSSSADAPVTSCNMCSTMAKAQYHMVMSDNTLRSFCRYSCATKYKNTFGFQVNGIQSADSSQNANSMPILREKPTQNVSTTLPVESENISQMKKKNVGDSVEDAASVTAELLRLLTPPTMVNKMTSCRPGTLTKGVYCKPHPWHRQTQTESSDINSSLYTSKPPPILPVPVPVYVPTPMMMYNMPCPVPVIVPIPLPVPIFIPTTAKTSEDIAKMMDKIQEEMPSDPYEAEMLLLARASSESVETQAAETSTQEDPLVTTESDNVEIDDLKGVDISCLNTVEEDLPRYPLKLIDDIEVFSNDSPATGDVNSEDEVQGQGKRKAQQEGPQSSRKRVCRAQSHESLSDTEDKESHATSLPSENLGEDFQGPFLNKMYGLAAWKKWVTTKNAELAGVSSSRSMKLVSEDLLSMNCEELNYALCLFLKDLRKPNGEPYQPDTVFYLLLGIQQHLFDSARTDCIFMDFGFEKLTNSFDEVTKTFLSQPVISGGLSPSCQVGVTRITETMLWECRQLGAHTPQVLLNTLFYFNTKVFKLKTIEEHQALSFTQIVKQWRRTVVGHEGSIMRTALLKYFPSKQDGKGRRSFEMHENKEDPLRCPVKLYEFYLSKCPESLRTQQKIYYVYPERSCVPDSPTWFSSQTVQPTSLSKMLHRALMVREVQESLAE